MRVKLGATSVVLLLLALSLAAPADARTLEGTGEFEFYAGAYLPGPAVLTNEPVIGFRGGLNIRAEWNVQVDFNYVRSESQIEVDATTKVDLDWKVSSIDLLVAYQLTPHRRWVTMLYAGPGWAFVDAQVEAAPGTTEEPLPDRLKEDTFFVAFGAGGKYFIDRKWYVRPDLRFRWIEQRDADAIDTDITFALGYNLSE
jgi:hypothetical protein